MKKEAHSLRLAALALFSLLLVASLFAGPAFCSESLQERLELMAVAKAPVDIKADRLEYDGATDTFNATGNVVITQGAVVLRADRVSLNTVTGDADASGSARLTDNGNVLYAERISVNFNTDLGVIEQGRIFVKKENYHISGYSMRRTSAEDYEVDRAGLTTCDGEVPFWKVTASELNVRMDKDVRAKNAAFRIKGVPVLYSPYAWFPLLKPRTSGLLFPSFGYSTDEGYRMLNRFYWAPVDNFDASLDIDYRSRRGLGAGLELRYAYDTDTDSSFYGYFLDDRKDKTERYRLELKHRQILPYDIYAKADVNLSERQFFRELSESARERTQRSIDSNVFFTRNWDWGRGYLLGQYTLGLDLNSDVIVQRLPDLGINVVKKQILHSPFYLDLDSSASYFTRESGTTGERLDLYPKLSASFNLGGVNISPRLGYRETVYDLTGKDRAGFDEERGLFGAGVSAQTGFMRLYAFDRGIFSGIRHTVEPLVAYNYVLRRGGTAFPHFDGIDSLGRRNMLAYELVNRFVIKYRPEDGAGDGPAREPRVDYLTVKLSQYYDFYEDNIVFGDRRALSSLFSDIVYKAGRHLTIRNDFRYNFDVKSFLSVNTEVRFDAPSGLWHVVLGQRYSKDTDQAFISPSRFDFFTPSTDFPSDFIIDEEREGKRINFLTAGAGVELGRWRGSGNVWYDVLNEGFREVNFSLGYSSQCWGIGVNFARRPGERQVMFTVSLKGLGNVKI